MAKFTPELRRRFSEESKGKVVESIEYDDVEDYWVITFTDGSELAIRLMAELAVERIVGNRIVINRD